MTPFVRGVMPLAITGAIVVGALALLKAKATPLSCDSSKVIDALNEDMFSNSLNVITGGGKIVISPEVRQRLRSMAHIEIDSVKETNSQNGIMCDALATVIVTNSPNPKGIGKYHNMPVKYTVQKTDDKGGFVVNNIPVTGGAPNVTFEPN